MEAAGGDIVVVGSGTPAQAKRFVEILKLTMPVVTDPTLEAYKRAGMKRSVLATIGPGSILRGFKTMKAGFKQHSTQGDPWQQGGVVVVGALSKGGRVTWQHASDGAGKPTDFGHMVEAMREAAKPS
ncbi:MAG: hypothetical protein NVSMB47_11010 [Polyangiales bacterium]